MKKLDVSGIEKELQAVYQRMRPRAERYGELNDREINSMVQRYRHGKR